MIVILVALMVVILGLTVAAVGAVSERFVRQQIATDLQTAARVFERFFADRVVQLCTVQSCFQEILHSSRPMETVTGTRSIQQCVICSKIDYQPV